ncbi:MAG: glucans biosynthesis glucosyltransferase MdoH [Rhodobacteraceae bacterium]|nr:glucans biosynthesis glucosyltransferase MdoH [Paracoccaceae bacterium]
MTNAALQIEPQAIDRDDWAPGPVFGQPTPRHLRRRRHVFLALTLATVVGLIGALAWLMHHGGITLIEGAMLVAFSATLPWLAVGFWNGIIGFLLDWRYAEPGTKVTPALARERPDAPIQSRVAIVMAVRNENVAQAVRRLERIQLGLNRTDWADQFDFHLLSDSDDPTIAANEAGAVAAWRARSPDARIHYRCRTDNSGFKAGNIMEFLDRCGDEYEFYLPLDADSMMGPSAILRLVRVMEASPEIGILQGLVVGTPSRTFFTRAFQFGMRHGMRAYTLGSAWWQGDCGPYWGHNALIRCQAFRLHCRLPHLEGSGPLAGDILSHDQIEASMMRRAGYEVRVLPVEDQSFEDNPPSLPDFIKRELRWCNGNFQYLRLLRMPGLLPVSRVQISLAIMMYVGAPAWFLFLALTAGLVGGTDQISVIPLAQGLTFFAVIMSVNLMPKLMGLAQVLVSSTESRRYGGRLRLLAGGLCEIIFGMLIAPAVALAVTIFVIGMMMGRRIRWDAQQRDRAQLAWSEAARALWPQTIAGTAFGIYIGLTVPWALIFAAPIIISLGGAIPLAVLSTHPALGAWSRRIGLFDIPEDRAAQEIAFDGIETPAKAATF